MCLICLCAWLYSQPSLECDCHWWVDRLPQPCVIVANALRASWAYGEMVALTLHCGFQIRRGQVCTSVHRPGLVWLQRGSTRLHFCVVVTSAWCAFGTVTAAYVWQCASCECDFLSVFSEPTSTTVLCLLCFFIGKTQQLCVPVAANTWLRVWFTCVSNLCTTIITYGCFFSSYSGFQYMLKPLIMNRL
jgi:hypothetical protein